MGIISFAWTTPALVAGRKTVTRREWSANYARRFKPGDLVQAYDRSPRFGGRCVAILRILSVRHETMSQMPDSDYEGEGFAYLSGRKIGPHDASLAGFKSWRATDGAIWVVRFEVVELRTEVVGTAHPTS